MFVINVSGKEFRMTVQEAIEMFRAGLKTAECKQKKELYLMAIQALEKQIPTKWMLDGFGSDRIDEHKVWRCTNCFIPSDKPTRYCPVCGQAMDWGRE